MHDENTEKILSDILTAEILQEMNAQIVQATMAYQIKKQGIAGPFSLGMKLYPMATMQELENKGFY